MTKWLIVPVGNGVYEVRARGKKSRKCDDLDSAQRYIKDLLSTRDKVVLEEDDGYQTTVTRSVRRCR